MKILKEATLGQIADEINAEPETQPGDIEETLDRMLRVNLRNARYGDPEFENVLLVGSAGVGKTARVVSWAKKNNINLFRLDAQGLDVTDLNGAIVPNAEGDAIKRLANTELDALDRPRSVLFLDEYNRARSDIRATLLTLINDHVINDPRAESGKRFLPNFLFTIAAINPSNANYNTSDLDQAERDRFYQLDVVPNKAQYLSYLKSALTKKMAKVADDPEEVAIIKGQIALAEKIVGDKRFAFDGPQDDEQTQDAQVNSLSPRSFAKLLQLSEGKKDLLLNYWDGMCNPFKKLIIEQILANYVDVDDKANDALKRDTDSDVFVAKSQNQQGIDAMLADLGIQ